MLARTAYKFNCGQGQWVKAFLLRWNVDLKNRNFKTVDQKNFQTGQRLIFKLQGIP
jgi:hypothetical protein